MPLSWLVNLGDLRSYVKMIYDVFHYRQNILEPDLIRAAVGLPHRKEMIHLLLHGMVVFRITLGVKSALYFYFTKRNRKGNCDPRGMETMAMSGK
jgi:hypothetical protein